MSWASRDKLEELQTPVVASPSAKDAPETLIFACASALMSVSHVDETHPPPTSVKAGTQVKFLLDAATVLELLPPPPPSATEITACVRGVALNATSRNRFSGRGLVQVLPEQSVRGTTGCIVVRAVIWLIRGRPFPVKSASAFRILQAWGDRSRRRCTYALVGILFADSMEHSTFTSGVAMALGDGTTVPHEATTMVELRHSAEARSSRFTLREAFGDVARETTSVCSEDRLRRCEQSRPVYPGLHVHEQEVVSEALEEATPLLLH